MRAKLVRIGNSRGVRLPKAMIEEAGLGDDLELTVRDGEIVIARVKKKVREGWAEAARHMAEHENGMWDDLEDFYEVMLPDEDWSHIPGWDKGPDA
jgi:antitoxin MazE